MRIGEGGGISSGSVATPERCPECGTARVRSSGCLRREHGRIAPPNEASHLPIPRRFVTAALRCDGGPLGVELSIRDGILLASVFVVRGFRRRAGRWFRRWRRPYR